jgi:glyoxylase-like metal-dependent hydrolase (beta-lactamase superfamily II)
MEIFPHVHQIQSTIADRNLFQYLFVGDNVVLLDTGMSSSPEAVILPYLSAIGLKAERLSLAVNTHADADHHGGNAALKRIAGNVLLACGDVDREVIENPDRLFPVRYNQWVREHGVGLSLVPGAEDWVRQMAGPAHRIDVTLRGGEQLSIHDRRSIRVLHVPGHSNGHLAFYDPENRALFVGDALHGMYCPSAQGEPSLPPAYFAVLAYLSTLQLIECMDVRWIYSGHWPAYRGPAVQEFLAQCHAFLGCVEQQIDLALERRPAGISLRDMIEECGPALGKWPPANRWLLMYPFHGHLTLREERGHVTRVKTDGLTLWRRC